MTGWTAHNAALRASGGLTVWFSEEAILAWEAEPRTTQDGRPSYSVLAITTALTLRAVFRLALRQTEGLIGSVLQPFGLDLAVPDHTEGLQRRNRLTWPLDGRFEDGRACWRFRGSGGMRELRVSGNLRVNNVDVLRAAALAGLSIALLPAWCVARELAADRLSRGLPQWQVTPTTFDRCIYAAYQRRPHLPPKILAFVDILAQVLRGGCWRRSSPARRPRIFSPRASLLLGGHYSQACPDGSCSPRLRSRRGHAGAGEAVAGPFAYARPGALGRARQGGRREVDGKQTP